MCTSSLDVSMVLFIYFLLKLSIISCPFLYHIIWAWISPSLPRLSKIGYWTFVFIFPLSARRQMTQSQHQNMLFPDTIAVCLDEDKSFVSLKFFLKNSTENLFLIRFLVDMLLQ